MEPGAGITDFTRAMLAVGRYSICMKGKIMNSRGRATITVFLLLAPLVLYAQRPGDRVFDGIQVHELRLTFEQTAWWDSLVIYSEQRNEQDLRATAVIEGVTFDGVGVRFRRDATFDHPFDKKPMRISFDEYVETQRWDGLRSVNLRNCYDDPSMMREKLHLDFCREAGIAAPRANYANVYLNGELWGVYSLVEQVNKIFLDTSFGEDNGNLFKSQDAPGVPSDLLWYGPEAHAYYDRYALQTNEPTNDWSDLLSFIETLNFEADIENALGTKINVSNYFRALAADVLFVNLDSYITSGRNYYVYHHLYNDKFEWIPSDVNQSFGNYFVEVPGKKEELSVFHTGDPNSRPLVGRVFQSNRLKQEYLKSLCQLFRDYFSAARLSRSIDSVANVIRPYVHADPRKQFTNAQFEANLDSDVDTGTASGAAGLKSFLALREANVKAQLDDMNLNCPPSLKRGDVVINEFMADNDSLIADPEGEYDDWIELYNNTAGELEVGGMYLSDDARRKRKWQIPANTVIAAHGYLIVWADEDRLQTGLHARFRLAPSGDSIYLSDVAGVLMDSVEYESQTTGMARVPNGTGDFVEQPATYATYNGGTGVSEHPNGNLPAEYALAQNHPNPFNPATIISYDLPKTSFVTLKVLDVSGREVATLVRKHQTAGHYDVRFEARAMATGVYFYKLEANDFVAVKKMLFAK